MHCAHNMSLRLQAKYDDVVLSLSDQPTVLGRSRELRISSTSVSRHACSVFAEGSVAKLVASKRVYVMRKGGTAVSQVEKDGTLQVLTSHNNIVKALAISQCSIQLNILQHSLPACVDCSWRHPISGCCWHRKPSVSVWLRIAWPGWRSFKRQSQGNLQAQRVSHFMHTRYASSHT